MKNFTERAINSTLILQKVGKHIFCLSLPSSSVAQKNKMCIQKSHHIPSVTVYYFLHSDGDFKYKKGTERFVFWNMTPWEV